MQSRNLIGSTVVGLLTTAMALCLCLTATAGMMGGGGMGGGGGGCGGGGGSVIDPPVGAAFADPPQIINVPGQVIRLEAAVTQVDVNGLKANLMTYNGSYPGPTIRVRSGDTVKIDLVNSLPDSGATNLLGHPKYETNLHTHGLHVSPAEPADYVMYSLKHGETYHHEYDLCMQEPGTLNMYHPHRHGNVAEQFWAGLMGCLVVEDANSLLSPYETHIMVLKDISLSGSAPAPHSSIMDYMHGKEGNVIMVNGKVNPRLTAKTGQIQRWRIVNASNARHYRLSLDSHSTYLIGTDGGLLDRPYPITEIVLSPSERVDILVKLNKTSGSYKFKSLPYSRMGMMTSETITLMTVTYSGKAATQSLPGTIRNIQRVNPNNLMIAAERTFTLSMGMGAGYINGQDFRVNPLYVMSDVNTWEIWNIVNQSNMDHPFHQHVNPAQVLSVTGGNAGYASLYTSLPAWKDTVLIPKMGSVRMLVPVMDWTGMAMFHCHILEHEDIGMMAIWDIMDMSMPPMPDM